MVVGYFVSVSHDLVRQRPASLPGQFFQFLPEDSCYVVPVSMPAVVWNNVRAKINTRGY